jgi:hypothetical protein
MEKNGDFSRHNSRKLCGNSVRIAAGERGRDGGSVRGRWEVGRRRRSCCGFRRRKLSASKLGKKRRKKKKRREEEVKRRRREEEKKRREETVFLVCQKQNKNLNTKPKANVFFPKSGFISMVSVLVLLMNAPIIVESSLDRSK